MVKRARFGPNQHINESGQHQKVIMTAGLVLGAFITNHLGSSTAKLYVPLIEELRLVDATDMCCHVSRVADWSEAHF